MKQEHRAAGILSGPVVAATFIINYDPFQRTWVSGHHIFHVPRTAETARHIPLGDPEAEPEHMGLARDGEVGYQRWSEL